MKRIAVLTIRTKQDLGVFAAELAMSLGDAEISALSDGMEVFGNKQTVLAVKKRALELFPKAKITLHEERT